MSINQQHGREYSRDGNTGNGNDSRKATVAGLDMLFTFCMTVATCLLTYLAFNANGTTEKQLRAYVAPVSITSNSLTVRNAGQTPANNVRVWIRPKYVAAGAATGKDIPPIKAKRGQRFLLGAGQDVEFTHNVEPPIKVTIVYQDVFDKTEQAAFEFNDRLTLTGSKIERHR